MLTRASYQLIFDLDDTLINSFEGYSRVHQLTARALGLRVLTEAELVDYDVDFPTTLRRQYAEVPGFEPRHFVEQWDAIADDHPYQAIDGVRASLEALLNAGHSLWIVTSRSRTRLAQRMREGGLRAEWFRGVYPRDEQPFQKPDPRCFEPVWQRLGMRPGDAALPKVLYVGDRASDQAAAAAAAVPFVAVQSGPEARFGFPSGIPASHVIPTAAHLPEWLNQHGY